MGNQESQYTTSECVVMPFDKILSSSPEDSLWSSVKVNLGKKISNETELGDIIHNFCSRESDIDRKSIAGLDDFFSRVVSKEEKLNFFEKILPKMQQLILRMPEIVPSQIPILLQNNTKVVTLSRLTLSVLICGAFFGIFPRNNNSHPSGSFNFIKFFRPDHNGKLQEYCVEKLRCLLIYFDWITSHTPVGYVSWYRRSNSEEISWKDSEKKLQNLIIKEDKELVDEDAPVKLVFSSKILGGGTLAKGCYYEEILFATHPELIPGILFSSEMQDNECVIVKGVQRFSRSSGIGNSFKFSGAQIEKIIEERDDYGHNEKTMIMLDPLFFEKIPKIDQWKEHFIFREINKLYVGFSGLRDMCKGTQLNAPIATGNWGCTQISATTGGTTNITTNPTTPIKSHEISSTTTTGTTTTTISGVITTPGSPQNNNGQQNQQQQPQSSLFGVMSRFNFSISATPTTPTATQMAPSTPNSALRASIPQLGVNVGAMLAGGGDLQLKSLLQLLAAAQVGRDLVFYTSEKITGTPFLELYTFLKAKDLTVGQIYTAILQVGVTNQLFRRIVKHFGGDPNKDIPTATTNKQPSLQKIYSGCEEKWTRSLKQCSIGVDLPRFLSKTTVINRENNTVIFQPRPTEAEKVQLRMKELFLTLAENLEIPNFEEIYAKYWTEKNAVLYDISRALDEFLIKDLGENNPLARLLKSSSSQGIIAPVVLQLKMSIMTDFPSKDAKGGWYIFVIFEKNNVHVVHRKKEVSMVPDEYEITWEVQMTFDINMIALQSTSFVVTQFAPLPNLGEEKKQMMADIYESWVGKSFLTESEELMSSGIQHQNPGIPVANSPSTPTPDG